MMFPFPVVTHTKGHVVIDGASVRSLDSDKAPIVATAIRLSTGTAVKPDRPAPALPNGHKKGPQMRAFLIW